MNPILVTLWCWLAFTLPIIGQVVTGPSSSTSNAIPTFLDATGKRLKNNPGIGYDGAALHLTNGVTIHFGTNILSVSGGALLLDGALIAGGSGDQVWTNANGIAYPIDLTSKVAIGTNDLSSLIGDPWLGGIVRLQSYLKSAVNFKSIASGTNHTGGPAGARFTLYSDPDSPPDYGYSIGLLAQTAISSTTTNGHPIYANYGAFGMEAIAHASLTNKSAAVLGYSAAGANPGDVTFGVVGNAQGGASEISVVGVAGSSLVWGASATNVGGYFEVAEDDSVPPIFENAVVLADNKTTGMPLLIGRTNNGTTVFKVDADGSLSLFGHASIGASAMDTGVTATNIGLVAVHDLAQGESGHLTTRFAAYDDVASPTNYSIVDVDVQAVDSPSVGLQLLTRIAGSTEYWDFLAEGDLYSQFIFSTQVGSPEDANPFWMAPNFTGAAQSSAYKLGTAHVVTNGYLVEFPNAGTNQVTIDSNGTIIARGGIGSLSTLAAVAIASGGWTNTFGVAAVVEIDGTGVTYVKYDNAGTSIYTNAATVAHASVLLQPSGKVLITAGTGITGTAAPF